MLDLWRELRRLEARTTDWRRFTGRTAIAVQRDATVLHDHAELTFANC